MHHLVPLVLGDGAQLWQSEPPQRAVHVFYENNVAKVVSERLMVRNLSPHCYVAGQPQLRIKAIAQHVYWAMHLVLPLQVDICRTSCVCITFSGHWSLQ